MGTVKRLTILAVLAVVYVKFHKVGTAAWCNVNPNTHEVQCNYNTKVECVTYLGQDEFCVPNDHK
jgi:hypothetical protein